MTANRSDLTTQLAALIRTHRGRRVPLTAIREHATQHDPTFGADPSARHRLRTALAELRDQSAIAWPKTRSGYDTRAEPELPLWVARIATDTEPAPARRPAPARVWPSALETAARLATRLDERNLLTTIAAWMAANPTPLVVPIQERSLEITGDEKRLDKLRSTRLFTSGALTLDMLACAPAPLPFASTYVPGVGSTRLLVAENSATYQSLTRALLAQPEITRPDTHLVWGAGRQFPIAAEHVSLLTPNPQQHLYFGDLDLAGLQIAANANVTITRVTGKPLQPAIALYETALKLGTPRPDPSNTAATIPDLTNLLSWLPPHLQPDVQTLIGNRYRIPQETVGLIVLLQYPDLTTS